MVCGLSRNPKYPINGEIIMSFNALARARTHTRTNEKQTRVYVYVYGDPWCVLVGYLYIFFL